ncbi:hypothetical protein JYU34_010382 [Plutella xylostella]|uniref:DDE Tnp4 domain-containing protein n=1 Tax=Plutella xylostella TaxID=51655 RepID=A0ABQ7QIC3_PLUXY|nr:hypothetical protein JYU34_010382 [Plutella xylostella]
MLCPKKYLLTPLPDPQTAAKRIYNKSQIRSRNVVERAFGVEKASPHRLTINGSGNLCTRRHLSPL